jgi:hypothetical protein
MSLLDQLKTFGSFTAAAAIVVGIVKFLLGREIEFRKALSRGLVRENSLYGCCSNLIFAIDQLEDPPAAVTQLRAQALAVMEDGRRRSHGKEKP